MIPEADRCGAWGPGADCNDGMAIGTHGTHRETHAVFRATASERRELGGGRIGPIGVDLHAGTRGAGTRDEGLLHRLEPVLSIGHRGVNR